MAGGKAASVIATARLFEAVASIESLRTPTELVKLLGPPLKKTTPVSGSETWTYEYTNVSALQLPYLPMMRLRQTPHEIITVRLVDGVVVDCTYFRETYVTRGRVLVPASTVQEPC